MSDDRTFAASQVRLVHVTSGWTAFVKDLGRLAPKTNVDSVVKIRKDDCSEVTHFDAGEFLITATVDMHEIQAQALRVRNNVKLNAFGGGSVTGVVEATTSVALSESEASLPSSPPMSFLIPRTDHAVVKRVNRNPLMMTESQ